MGIHSTFLVHWTGKDFDPNAANIREQYVERLKNCCQLGLYMNIGRETINGSNSKEVMAFIARVCFTEIRLSQAQTHANLYGKLGIGFDRNFVLERMGGPAFYVQNSANGVIIEHFDYLHGFLANNHHNDMLARLQVIMGYLKNMSTPGDTDLVCYEEMEWRVVHLKCLEMRYVVPEKGIANIYRLKFDPEDVKLIVFPDKETKLLALGDADILNFFKMSHPIMTTISDCMNF
jgi:hypothetical protein